MFGGQEPIAPVVRAAEHQGTAFRTRSEEHTSELQSLTNLVCRLLLEKKKKNSTNFTAEGVSKVTRTRAQAPSTTSEHCGAARKECPHPTSAHAAVDGAIRSPQAYAAQ